MDTIRQATETLTEEARNRINEAAEEALEKGRKAFKSLREQGEKMLEEARSRGSEAWDDTQKLVRKYPTRAVGIALLVGAVLGTLIAHNDD